MAEDYQVHDRRSAMRSLLKLRPYLQPHVHRLTVSVAVMLLGAGASIVLPMVARIAIDRYIGPGDIAGLIRLILGAVTLFILVNLSNAVRARLMAQVGQDIIRDIRRDLFHRLQSLPVSFFDKIPVGKVITRLTSDVDALSELVSNAIVNMIIDSLKLFGFLGVMLWLDVRMTAITLLFLPLLVFAITVLNSRIHKAEDLVREQASAVNANSQETISGMRVIQAFGAQEYFDERFAKANKELLNSGLRAVRVFAYFWPLVDLSWLLSLAALLYFGGRWVMAGSTTTGTLIAFISYSGQFFGPLRGLSQAYRIIQRALAGAVRIDDIFATPAEVDPRLPAMPPIAGEVEFKDIVFGYDNDEIVLRDISLKAEVGETIALVGHTGAGKTSIINLLCRFYQPQSGQILVDGCNVLERELVSYRRQIGLVLQDPFLFSGTLRENLRFGAPDASEEQMWQALQTVGLADPFRQQGITLETMLTERGSNFSTGQRQLLSFARALLADPRILILDEATAHVDTVTEQKVQAALEKLLEGRTSFVIAHRLSTIRSADQIIVIGKGKILERGTHEELLIQRGEYWQLVAAQESAATASLTA